MKYQRQSRSERIVRFAKISAIAAALTLIPGKMHSRAESPEPPQAHAKAKTIEDKMLDCKYPISDLKLGKAVELFENFPEYGFQIPAAKSVDKIPNPEANKFLICVKNGTHTQERMSWRYRRQVRRNNGDVYSIISHCREKYGLKIMQREGLHSGNLMDYLNSVTNTLLIIELKKYFDELRRNRDKHSLPSKEVLKGLNRRYNQIIQELEYDAVKKLVVEEKIEIYSAEDSEAHRKAGELISRLRNDPNINVKEFFDAVFRIRNKAALEAGAWEQDETVIGLYIGGLHHDWGSLEESIKEWNADPENKYAQYCAAIITPKSYPEK